MADEKLIREIVGTYELPERTKEKIIRIAKRMIEEKVLASFDDQYRYISELVEKFQFPFRELRALRLDSPVIWGSNTTFHKLIGYNNPDLGRLFEDEENKAVMSAYEAVDILREQIDKSDFDLMLQLLYHEDNSDITFHALPEQIISYAPQIQERLEALIKKYERGGRFVIPRRPIVYVKFDPSFLVKFGNRRYNGNPLAFFREHIGVYDRMGRSKLQKFDQGLYSTLWIHGQLDEAIPEKHKTGRKELSQSQISEILAAHPVYKGNTSEAARCLPYSQGTIWKYWKAAGLGFSRVANRKEHQINEIVDAYSTYKGNAAEAERRLPYSKTTIIRHWENAGLKAYGRRYLKKSHINEIVDAHPIYGGNISEAARHLPYSYSIIRKYWIVAGLTALGESNK